MKVAVATALPEARGMAPELPGWVVPELDYPTFRITLIAKVMDRLTLRRLAETGELTLAQWRVLARLAANPGSTVGQIADLAWVDRAEVSRAVAALEKRGLTTRVNNPADARTPLLSCTAAGLEQYRKVLADRQAFHEQLMSDLSEDELGQLDDLLVRIAHRVVDLGAPAH